MDHSSFGSGSRDVMAAFDKAQYQKALQSIDILKEDFLIEELVLGQEYGLSGVVLDGVYHHILIRQKLLTPFPYRQCIANISQKENKEVSKYMQKVATALGLKNSLINADIIIDENGTTFIIEIAPRPSGHYLSSNFVLRTTGVNMTKEWINFVLKKEFSFKPKFYKQGIIRYFDLQGRYEAPDFKSLKDELGIVDYECHINARLGEVKDGASIMGRGYAILQANKADECYKNAEILMSKFKRIDDE